MRLLVIFYGYAIVLTTNIIIEKMRKYLITLCLALFIVLSLKGQNLFFIGENSFPCTEKIALQSNAEDGSDLIILFAKDGKTGLLGVITESSFGSQFSDKVIIYLEDGKVLTCTKKRASDLVDNLSKAAFPLTSDQLEKLKNSNIHTVRYSLELNTLEGLLLGERSWTASNTRIHTNSLIARFFYEGKTGETVLYKEQATKVVEDKPRELDRSQLFSGQESSTGAGDGISFSLGGRSALKLPTPEYPPKKSGTVVVEVTVDRNGNVTNVRGGVRGSTTNDTELINAAERVAHRAKFDVSQKAPAYQTGTITYVFRLQD